MGRRLTCTEEGANKFWEASLDGASLTTTWGKAGTAGQTKSKTFASPELAAKELAKLVKEKLGKGYVDEGGADVAPVIAATIAPSTRASVPGKYTNALFALLRSGPKRAAPFPVLDSWLAKETRADLRALFEILRDHDPGAASVGDFSFWGTSVGGRVPRQGDAARDRDDVISIGATGGGDLFVVAAPGTSAEVTISEILHEEDWSKGQTWSSLEHFLEDQVRTYRERCLEDGDEEDDIHTDLDPFLAAPRPTAERTIEGHGLALTPSSEPAREKLVSGDKAQAEQLRKLFNQLRGANYGTYGWYETFWHGRYAFGIKLCTVERGASPWIDLTAVQDRLESMAVTLDVYRATIFERTEGDPIGRLIEPAIIASWPADANYDSTLPYAFKSDGSSLLVNGGSAFKVIVDVDKNFARELVGGGAVHEIAPSTGIATCVRSHEGSDDVLAVGWLGDRAALLRETKKGNVLDVLEKRGGVWKLARSIGCGKCNVLFGLDGGSVAVLTSAKKSAKAKTFFLGVRGDDVRLLGVLDGILKAAVTTPDRRSFVEESGDKWSELLHLDNAG